MIRSKFDDYQKGDWDQWQSKYHHSARIFYNSASNPMTTQQAAKMHEDSVQGLSNYYIVRHAQLAKYLRFENFPH